MDDSIDELFDKLFKITKDEDEKAVTKILVTLNYLLPGIFQHALDLVELHKVVRKEYLRKPGDEQLQGIMTRYTRTVGQPKTVWVVQPVVKEKKGGYTASPLQGTAWGYLVDLDRWHCSCQEFTKAQYTSEGDYKHETSATGWGGPLFFEAGRVPVCVHVVTVFLFTKGRCLFEWKEQGIPDSAFDDFPCKTVTTVDEWIVLCS